jgi:hypothetical protein
LSNFNQEVGMVPVAARWEQVGMADHQNESLDKASSRQEGLRTIFYINLQHKKTWSMFIPSYQDETYIRNRKAPKCKHVFGIWQRNDTDLPY